MFDRPTAIRNRLQAPLLLAGAVLLLWFAFESMLYRSGAYLAVAEPDSNAGAVVNALLVLDRHFRPGVRTVLVLGDSRVAEGFSGPLARADSDVDFISLSVPGSTPRTWYYLLREVNRRGYRYEAVLIGMFYRPIGSQLSDWPLAPTQDAALLGLRDALAYPASFSSAPMQARARQSVLFPAASMRLDMQALLAAPAARWYKLHDSRPGYIDFVPHYPGREEHMPALKFAGAGTVIDWGAASTAQRAVIAGLISESQAPVPAAILAANRAYLQTWLGAIVRLAQDRGAHAIAFPLPRGPYPEIFGVPVDAKLVHTVASVPGLTALPADLLQALEQPDNFFDGMHVNRAGRERMSAVVGEQTRTLLQARAR